MTRSQLLRRFLFRCASILISALLVGCNSARPDLALRVMTYNIHHGEGTDGEFDLDRLARVIRTEQPDFVALQEVDVRTSRASGIDQAATLGVLTNMHAAFGRAMEYAGGEYGEAVLSRFPIDEARAIALPATEGREPRCALLVRATLPGTDQQVAFVGTHLDHLADDSNRLMQVRTLLEELEALDPDTPVVLCGDLNDTPNSRTLDLLRDRFSDAAGATGKPTYPSDVPSERIDYILVRPSNTWTVQEMRIVDEQIASDHRPVVADLLLTPARR